jgi:hypothetical protein
LLPEIETVPCRGRGPEMRRRSISDVNVSHRAPVLRFETDRGPIGDTDT